MSVWVLTVVLYSQAFFASSELRTGTELYYSEKDCMASLELNKNYILNEYPGAKVWAKCEKKVINKKEQVKL